jgi:UDP-N-acetylglucosamine:LPS N-acetylglucosamine transferase
MNGLVLAEVIRDMFGNAEGLKEMQRSSRGLGRPDACSKIVDLAMGLLKKTPSQRKGS